MPPLTLKLLALSRAGAVGVGDVELAVIVHLDVQAAGRGQDHAVDIAIAADMQDIAVPEPKLRMLGSVVGAKPAEVDSISSDTVA